MRTGTDGQQPGEAQARQRAAVTDDSGGGRKNDELFVQHYEFMFATARKFLKQKADAEDLVLPLKREGRVSSTLENWKLAVIVVDVRISHLSGFG